MEPRILLTALGLALLLEGIPSFIAPAAIRRAAGRMGEVPEIVLRLAGLAAMLGGLLLVWLSRR